jgi:hypothetical protein
MSIFKAFFGLGKIPQVIKFFEFKSFDDVNKMGGAIAQIKQRVREGGLQLTQAQQKFLDDQMKQVKMVFEKIQQPTKETGIKSTQSAKILDLQGQEIPQGSKIMGGKAIKETEAEIAERLGRENKQAVGNIRKKKLRDEISKLDDKIEARKLQLEQRGVEDFETDSLFNKLDEQRNDLELKLDFEDMVDPENMAQGGRIGLKAGMSKRAFLKLMGGAGAGLAALKTGALKLLGKDADTVKNLPPIKTPITKLENTTTQMPDWFPSFVNKFRNEGKAKNVFKQEKVEVSKAEYDKAIAEGKGENYYTDVARTSEYKANNPDHMDYFKYVDTDERVYTTYTNEKIPNVQLDDMDGQIDVMFQNEYSQPVSINYTAPGKRGPETGRADIFMQGEAKLETKPKGDFVANDVEVYATDPDGGSESVDVIADTLDDMLEGTTRQMQEYATGKKVKKLSRGEGRMIEAEIRAEQAADAAAEAAAEAADDFASGGIARMLGE